MARLGAPRRMVVQLGGEPVEFGNAETGSFFAHDDDSTEKRAGSLESRTLTPLEWFRHRPKAELHLHLEGTLTRARYREWARADGVAPEEGGPLPRGTSFDDFRHFLGRYAEGCRRIARAPERIEQLVSDWAAAAVRENICYAELTFSPVIFTGLGLPYDELADALGRGLEHARRLGIEVRLILDVVRQWGPHAAEKVLRFHADRPLPGSVAFGLAGDESSVPAADFRSHYDEARRLGLRTTLHAGEWCGADSIREGLDELGPDRIAHGIAAINDPDLLRRIVREKIPLDLAVTSNLRTGAVRTLAEHPVARLVRAGARVTISTDDPTYFGCTLSSEAALLARRFGFTRDEVDTILAQGFDEAFDQVGARRAKEKLRLVTPPAR